MQFRIHNIWADGQWSSAQGGPMDRYRMNVTAQDGTQYANVELSKKAGNAPPEVNSIVEGEISQTNHGPRFKQAYNPQGGGGGGGGQQGGGQRPAGGGGGGGFPPHVQASITYQHSQDVAVQLMAILPVPNEKDGALAMLRELSGAIAQDVGRVWEKHGGPPRMGAEVAQGPPAQQQAPAPAQQPAAQPQGFGTQQPAGQQGFGAAQGGDGFGGQQGGFNGGGQQAPAPAPADDDIPF